MYRSYHILYAIEILEQYLVMLGQDHLSLPRIMQNWTRKNRQAGSRDRHNISNIIYDVLRNYQMLSYVLHSKRADQLVLLSCILGDKAMQYDQIRDLLMANQKTAYLAAVLDDIWQIVHNIDDGDIGIVPGHVLANIEQWQQCYFSDSFPEDWVEHCESLASLAPIDLRVNSLRCTAQQAALALKEAGFACSEIELSNALRIDAAHRRHQKLNVLNTELYKTGCIEVQDLGSQIVSRLIGAKAGDVILDYCAGAGGKSLAMAQDMGNCGKIYAYDKIAARIAPLHDRIQRNGIKNVEIVENLAQIATAQMDIVVVDAPCSGSGTWRRYPEQKLQLTEHKLLEIAQLQQEILIEAAKYVKPGGRICYITCSMFKIENDANIEKFIAQNSKFKVVSPMAYSSGLEKWRQLFIATQYGVQLTPKLTNTDGFYFSILDFRSL